MHCVEADLQELTGSLHSACCSLDIKKKKTNEISRLQTVFAWKKGFATASFIFLVLGF